MTVLKWLLASVRKPAALDRETFDYSLRAGQARIEIFDDAGHTAYVAYVPREALVYGTDLSVTLPPRPQTAVAADALAA